jgi:hypothetical protein
MSAWWSDAAAETAARTPRLHADGKEAMSTEVVGLILAALIVAYSIRTALSGMRGRPKGPMV